MEVIDSTNTKIVKFHGLLFMVREKNKIHLSKKFKNYLFLYDFIFYIFFLL